ncbi:MAG: hypothetical protein ACK5PP_10215, partial [Acidimicrobiales bacterium]
DAARRAADAVDAARVGEEPRAVTDRAGLDHRWVLDIATPDGLALLDVEPAVTGRLGITDRAVGPRSWFRVAAVGPVGGSGTALDVRSGADGAPLTLDPEPRCLPAALDDDQWADRPLGIPWLRSTAAGLRLLGPAPGRLEVVVDLARRDDLFELIHWTGAGGRRHRLVCTGMRFLVVAGESRIVAASPRVRLTVAAVAVTAVPGAGHRIEIYDGSGSVSGPGAELQAAGGVTVGVLHRISRSDGGTNGNGGHGNGGHGHGGHGNGAAEPESIRFDEPAVVRVGSGDPAAERLTGTAGSPIRSVEPVAVDGAVTVASWVRLTPHWRRDGWTGWSLTDEAGRTRLGLHGPPGGGQEVTVDGATVRLPALLTGARWFHVAVRVEPVGSGPGSGSAITVVVDGEEVAAGSVPALPAGRYQVTAGVERADVDRFTLWFGTGAAATPDDTAAHFLRPSAAPRRSPAIDWVIDPGRDRQGVVGIGGTWSGGRPDRSADPLTPVLARGPYRATSALVATVVGRRHGRPSFVLSADAPDRPAGRVWLAVGGDGRLTTTSTADDAAEIGLRAVVLDEVPDGEPAVWFRAYGAPGEDPGRVAASLGIQPVTAPALAREREWQEACRRAGIDRTAADLDWLAAWDRAAARVRSVLAAAWIDLAVDGLAPAAAAAVLDRVAADVEAEPERTGLSGAGFVGVAAADDAAGHPDYGRPPLAGAVERWEATVAAAAGSDDPIGSLLGALGAPVRTVDGVAAGLAAAGAGRTSSAAGWTLDLGEQALGSWRPGARLRER